jgi:hypothetical protein
MRIMHENNAAVPDYDYGCSSQLGKRDWESLYDQNTNLDQGYTEAQLSKRSCVSKHVSLAVSQKDSVSTPSLCFGEPAPFVASLQSTLNCQTTGYLQNDGRPNFYQNASDQMSMYHQIGLTQNENATYGLPPPSVEQESPSWFLPQENQQTNTHRNSDYGNLDRTNISYLTNLGQYETLTSGCGTLSDGSPLEPVDFTSSLGMSMSHETEHLEPIRLEGKCSKLLLNHIGNLPSDSYPTQLGPGSDRTRLPSA